ncbi:MAG: diaminopimelate epimerase [Planctomycetota bacterium]
MRFEHYSGAGNRFLLIETTEISSDWASVAIAACAREGSDGLLILHYAVDRAWHMIIFNADGTRPEACGNGLRCIAWHLTRTGGGSVTTIQTDAGPRRVEVLQRSGNTASVVTEMGVLHTQKVNGDLPRISGLLEVLNVNIGNPHCVLRVEDERDAPVEFVGRSLQDHTDYPHGVNVGFLSLRDSSWHLRVWERGVGETSACGTGACAASALISEKGTETMIKMRGGPLRVRLGLNSCAELFGEAVYLGDCELDLAESMPDSRDSARKAR